METVFLNSECICSTECQTFRINKILWNTWFKINCIFSKKQCNGMQRSTRMQVALCSAGLMRKLNREYSMPKCQLEASRESPAQVLNSEMATGGGREKEVGWCQSLPREPFLEAAPHRLFLSSAFSLKRSSESQRPVQAGQFDACTQAPEKVLSFDRRRLLSPSVELEPFPSISQNGRSQRGLPVAAELGNIRPNRQEGRASHESLPPLQPPLALGFAKDLTMRA